MTTGSKAPSRLLVLLTMVVLASVLLLASAVHASGIGDTPRPAAATVDVATPGDAVEYRVRPGDTLWDVAASVAGPEDDLRRIVHELKRRNGLEDSLIRPGQVLLIPTDH